MRFSKSYNKNFNIGPLKIIIDEKEIPVGIKIIKISRDVLFY
jgi:hypothetical protein